MTLFLGLDGSLTLALITKPAAAPAMHLSTIAAVAALICAAIPAILFAMNVALFRRPGRFWNRRPLPPVSVLIPARNEEASIGAAISAVLASRGVDLELIVLDDHSTDRTAEIVSKAAAADPRVRLASAPTLPPGWNGKQHACSALASLATRDVFCFLDADVRIGPEALYHMASELNHQATEAEASSAPVLVSGFPRQETVTFLGWLLLPLIHFVLLGFLPMIADRRSRSSAFASGCGQFMMVRRQPYFASGSHAAIRTTMHDGLLLPQLLRTHGFRTAVYDLTRDAVCRMYSTDKDVWDGLAKNATEGMASPRRITVFTVLLMLGQVLPLPILAWSTIAQDPLGAQFALDAALVGYAIRLVCLVRYRQDWRGALLHPVGVLVLLSLQWNALFRKLKGQPATWKQRAYLAE